MAPKTRGSRGRRGGRARGGAVITSPPSAPTTSIPATPSSSWAIVPYKAPMSVKKAQPELGSSSSKDPLAVLEEAVASMHQARARFKNVAGQEANGESPQEIDSLNKDEDCREKSYGSSSTSLDLAISPPTSGRSSPSFSPTVIPDSSDSSPAETLPPPSKRTKITKSKKKVSVPHSLSVAKLLELVRGLNIVQERSFSISRLGELFKLCVQVQAWEEMLDRMATARLNLTVVREFYAQLAVSLGPLHKAESLDNVVVTIRNKQIIFKPSIIRNSFGLPLASMKDKQRTDDDLKKISKEYVVEKCYMNPPAQIPHDLSCGLLHVSYRMLAYLVQAILYPTSQTSQLPLTEAKFLCYLAVERKQIPAEYYLFENIKKIAITIARGKIGTKTSLFHPAIISILCQQQEVASLEGDEIAKPVQLTASSVNRSNKHSINPGPSLEVEAAISAARQSAQMLANNTEGRLSKIEDSISGLRSEVADLHKDISTLQQMIRALHDAVVSGGQGPAQNPPCQS